MTTILRCLDVSTAALQQPTMDALSANAIDGVVGYPNEYGAFVPIRSNWSEDEAREEVLHEHPELVALIDWCVTHDVQLIRFDCDGGEVPNGLPQSDW